MLSATNYAQNYAGIIGKALAMGLQTCNALYTTKYSLVLKQCLIWLLAMFNDLFWNIVNCFGFPS